MGGRRLERVEDILDLELEVLRELVDGRRASAAAGQPLLGLLDFQRLLLSAARDVHGPTQVTEVTLELTEDGRHGEGGKGRAAIDVEAVDGFDQSKAGDLKKVVERLPSAGVTP